jgi:streptogramin lyase
VTWHTVRELPAPGRHLCGLAWDGEALWHSDAGTETIYRLDPTDGRVLRELPCPAVRTCLSWDGRLWQVAGRPKALRCLDPETGEVLGELPLPSEDCCGIEVDGDEFWVSWVEGERIERRHLSDGAFIAAFPAERRVAGITFALGLLWYAVDEHGIVVAVEAATGRERLRERVEGTPTGLTWDGKRLWYADFAGARLVAFEPREPPTRAG